MKLEEKPLPKPDEVKAIPKPDAKIEVKKFEIKEGRNLRASMSIFNLAEP